MMTMTFASGHLRLPILCSLALALALPAPPVCAQDLARGVRNYQAIMEGHTTLEALSPGEQKEVLLVYQAMKSRREDNGSGECQRARQTAESAAEAELSYTKRLSQCIANGGLTDDCNSEFRHVRSAQDDYESAVTGVQNTCR